MDKVTILDVKEKILIDNDQDADVLRETLNKENTYYINLMSSPGSGKTTTLLQTIKRLKEHFNVGVMEADIDSDVDAYTMTDAGIDAVQLHTGGMCHLSADMSRQGLEALGKHDVVFLENVGNLVCPAEFDTGAHMNLVILSVPEGDDKPLKYPLMFEKADVVLINKIDALPVFDFDFDKVKEGISLRNKEVPVFPISSLTGEGIDAWCEYLINRINAERGQK